MSLIGRNKELDRILAVVQGARETALAVVGEQGAGKSALLAEVPGLSGYRTIFLQASTAEYTWAWSGLTALLAGLDDPAAGTIGDGLLRGGYGALSVPAVSGMLLNALQERSTARTVLVIDDADRLDAGSQAVTGYLARRLAGTNVALVVSLRTCTPDSPFAGLPVLRLGPLGYSETVRMLQAIPARNMTPAAAHAVAAATHGNPLAAVELHSRLSERRAGGKNTFPVPLPCTGSFEAGFAAAVRTLSPAGRGILALLSLSRRSDLTSVEAVSKDARAGMDELLARGLVDRRGPHLLFRNQLLRGYVYAQMPAADRAAGHRALAAATRTVDPSGHRWHRSFLPADEVHPPSGLLRDAIALVRAGDVPLAVEFIERDLTLNTADAGMAAGLTTAAELLFNRGELEYARRYLGWAQRLTRNPALLLRLAGLAFEIEFVQGSPVRPGMVVRLVQESGRHHGAYAARLLALGALYYAERWAIRDAAELLRYAGEFHDVASTGCLAVMDHAAVLIESITRGTEPAWRRDRAGRINVPSLLVQGRALSYAERYSQAQEVFTRVRASARPSQANWRETALFLAVDNEIRAGNVRSAIKLIDELEANETENKYHRGMRHIFRVWQAYALGDEALARMLVVEARQYFGAGGQPSLTARLAACQGHFALLRGDLAQSLAQLSRAMEIGTDFGNPALLRCEADLVEVLVRLGRHSEATQALRSLEERSAGLRSSWLTAAVARSRAMLADGGQSLELFSQALEGGSAHDPGLERARTLLCYAERLNAFGRLREARDKLLRAKVVFDEAGADAWSQHVDALLLDERVEPARPQGNPALLMLADHERTLATMVAGGMRNKEIAASLYVSVRTVEVRLTSIYRKLGVESRAQLTALAAGRESAPREPYVLPVL